MNLQDLDHLRDDKRVRFAEETVNGETVTIVCYMVASPDLWEIPSATECRGIVFDSNGDCISRPFHKFFNVGECEATQLHNLPELTEVLEKRDGSMVTPVLVGGQIAWKSKKSFYSDVAVDAGKNVPANVHNYASYCLLKDMTPVFEYTSGNNRVVLDYGSESKFVLLAVRDNVTGDYINYDQMSQVAVDLYGVEVIDVNEAYTSKTASWTGEIKQNLGGAKTITSGGVTLDRDINGARGILLRALVDKPSLATLVCSC